eukprot:CAMPEP_0115600064 /NCGR_PEP_ID=MMETSP0272-20121206/14704_1 /TAXON_ID=71861 /ORGANISM="Scrippsiella trochoidea, Strain CCMP3099" /LENGTH=470 /DNA_ID=CAMNT_0003035513 /DNA_START=26 /DNA_END=1435 /DNA_ORIENTATION=-
MRPDSSEDARIPSEEGSLQSLAHIEVKKIGRGVDFPPRGASAGDSLSGEGILLRPHSCSLGSAGRQPASVGDRAQGIWRGIIHGSRHGGIVDAVARVVPLLAGTLQLECGGTLACAALDVSALRFVDDDHGTGDERPEDADAVAMAMSDGAATSSQPARFFRLAGQLGQVLSHDVHLWIAHSSTGSADDFDVLLRLQPCPRRSSGDLTSIPILQFGPLGVRCESWEEVPMIECPRLLRLMMGESAAIRPATERYLVEEPEEILVIRCWRRREVCEVEGASADVKHAGDGISLEQLLWLDVLAALSETKPCEEEPVPAARVKLADEGLATRAEILGDVSGDGAPAADGARLASLAFLRQYVQMQVLREEVLPKLLPEGTGSGSVRIFSAELTESCSMLEPKKPVANNVSRPRTLDALFDDNVDFRRPGPWASTDVTEDPDPLHLHELTSVLLLNDRTGFMLGFHCLQAADP